jgi:endonuclease/exonuclease/phosphatase family metal-dependent hydrolase
MVVSGALSWRVATHHGLDVTLFSGARSGNSRRFGGRGTIDAHGTNSVRRLRESLLVRSVIASVVAVSLGGGCSGCQRKTAKPAAVRGTTAAAVTSAGEESVAGAVWDSREACERAWSRRPTTGHVPRIATWNVRYFPDGVPEDRPDEDQATDVGWLGCTLALLDAEVIVVQEFKRTDRAMAHANQLIESLNRRTGGNWKLELVRCSPENVQHPGFLYDAARVTVTRLRSLHSLNPYEACTNEASPGFAGYFEFAAGPDLHLVALHLQAGKSAESMKKRNESLQLIDDILQTLQAVEPDRDVVLTGDFNNTGCPDCEPQVEPAEELATMSAMLAGTAASFRVIPANQPCSEFHGGDFYLLDHFAVSGSMREVARTATARVSGFCAAVRCSADSRLPTAEERLSDHCPVLLDLEPGDFD